MAINKILKSFSESIYLYHRSSLVHQVINMTLSRALLLEVHLGGMASDCVIVHCPEVILATGVILIELQQGADGNLSGRGDAAAQSRKRTSGRRRCCKTPADR
jgi:hypothetical protein